jgi:hypothetical protein
MGGGFTGTVISRRGAEFFWRWIYVRTQCHESRDKPARYSIRRTQGFVATGFTPGLSATNCGIDPLAAAFASVHLGGMTSVSSGTATVFASEHLGGMTSVSSGTAAGEADMTNSP